VKSRAGAIAAAVVLAGLVVLAGWMWMGHDYVVRFDDKDLEFTAAVLADQSGVPRLWIHFGNLTERRTLLVARSESLRGPFTVEVYSLAEKRLLSRVDPEDFPQPRRDVLLKLRAGSRQNWSVPLTSMFGPLKPGAYKLRLVYDPAAARESGVAWYREMELDVGRVETGAIPFEIKPADEGKGGKKEPAPRGRRL
jgi:hypothetical protein